MFGDDSLPRAAYVHVPFCRHRCGYCDFTLVAGKDHLIDDYLRALEWELRRIGRLHEVEMLYIGGGTPTHLSPGQLRRMLELVRKWLPLAQGAEFTVEANPADVNSDRVTVLAEFGVNRVSLGVQSFQAEILKMLERDHLPGDVVKAVECLRQRLDNLSFDLIFGVPGQSLEIWQATLDAALQLEPWHVSTYGLTFEKGTQFWTRRQQGRLVPLPAEIERDMYAAAMDTLSAADFEQYEISNFARAGFRCRHNEVYWSGQSYFGFGPGAARYVNGRRETNHRSVTTWLRKAQSGKLAVGEAEELSPEDRARELAVLGLRRCEGIDCETFRERSGFALDELAGEVIVRHTAAGLLETVDGRLRLTREGRFLADTVVVDLL